MALSTGGYPNAAVRGGGFSLDGRFGGGFPGSGSAGSCGALTSSARRRPASAGAVAASVASLPRPRGGLQPRGGTQRQGQPRGGSFSRGGRGASHSGASGARTGGSGGVSARHLPSGGGAGVGVGAGEVAAAPADRWDSDVRVAGLFDVRMSSRVIREVGGPRRSHGVNAAIAAEASAVSQAAAQVGNSQSEARRQRPVVARPHGRGGGTLRRRFQAELNPLVARSGQGGVSLHSRAGGGPGHGGRHVVSLAAAAAWAAADSHKLLGTGGGEEGEGKDAWHSSSSCADEILGLHTCDDAGGGSDAVVLSDGEVTDDGVDEFGASVGGSMPNSRLSASAAALAAEKSERDDADEVKAATAAALAAEVAAVAEADAMATAKAADASDGEEASATIAASATTVAEAKATAALITAATDTGAGGSPTDRFPLLSIDPNLPPLLSQSDRFPLVQLAPEPLPVMPPAQLEVIHVQSIPSRLSAAEMEEGLTIVLPDGSIPAGVLGEIRPAEKPPTDARVASCSELLLEMPPPPPTAARPPPQASQEIGDSSSVHEPSLPPHEKPLDSLGPSNEVFKSVSERLAALLGPLEAPELPPPKALGRDGAAALARRATQVDFRATGADASVRRRALLRRNHVVVLSNIQVLTDGILQNVLGDTVEMLNSMPSARPAAIDGDDGKSSAVAGVGRPLAAKASPEPCGLARWTLHEAADELWHLEDDLTRRYLGPRPATQAITPSIQPALRTNGDFNAIGRSDGLGAGLKHAQEDAGGAVKIQSAALSSERVKCIEQYRARFARHCLAAREAGLDFGGPGGLAPSTATWIVWPYLADLIVNDVVDHVIEEANEAMEKHIDEMVREELEGITLADDESDEEDEG
eukprot:TRINITY_DN48687_c0_g1_i1.p1 TRINITY_DN48687_c0_g1~~TRINITY_DN48687_c0_g1_i1.p1  ORF type:complete len:869 (+),score=177.35 TRINITY_DN48687_c0_g1_i1:219-2825(+)